MSTKLFIGNLPWSSTEQELEEAFGVFGSIEDVHIPKDRDTGRPRGFAFVTFADADAANKAIEEMHDKELGGRPLTVNEARPQNNG